MLIILILGRDLILRLLDPNPNTRITAVEALKHPWLYQINQDERAANIVQNEQKIQDFSDVKRECDHSNLSANNGDRLEKNGQSTRQKRNRHNDKRIMQPKTTTKRQKVHATSLEIAFSLEDSQHLKRSSTSISEESTSREVTPRKSKRLLQSMTTFDSGSLNSRMHPRNPKKLSALAKIKVKRSVILNKYNPLDFNPKSGPITRSMSRLSFNGDC